MLKNSVRCTIVAAGTLGAVNVVAQEQPAQLEEVVVTATKREQRLIDVPASVTVLDANALKSISATRFVDYGRSIPSLAIVEEGPGETGLNIRGITTGRGVETEGTVAVYLDETPITGFGNFQADLRTFDLERIEVLKGPQGTLFGSNAMGGAIRFITRKPSADKYSVDLDAALSKTAKAGDPSEEINGAINVPLVAGRLGLRASAYYHDDAGWVDNAFRGEKDVNSSEVWGARVSLLFTPSDDLSLQLSGVYQDAHYGGDSAVDPNATDFDPNADRFTSVVPAKLFMDDVLGYVNATLNYRFSGMELVSSTTYHSRDFDNRNDFTATFTGGVVDPIAPLTEPVTLFTGNNTIKGVIHETRLVSDVKDRRFNYLAGLYYEDLKKEDDQYLNNESLAFSQALFGPAATTDWFDATITNFDRQKAVFGELRFGITQRTELAIGGRYTDFRTNDESFIFGEIADVISEADATLQKQKHSETNSIGRAVLTFKPTSDWTLYGSVAQGFRGGGFGNDFSFLLGTGLITPEQVEDFKDFVSDSLINYEVGAKTRLADGRASVSAALFYIDWTDIQLNANLTGTPFTFTDNGGKAHSQGLELEGGVRITDHLSLNGGLSLIEAKLDEDTSESVGGRKGDRLPLSAPMQGAFTLDYQRPVAGGRWLGFATANYTYTGKVKRAFSVGANQADTLESDSYSLVGARIGARTSAVEIALFGRNLFDEHAVLISQRAYGGSRFNERIIHPREIGLNVTYHW